jgi:hypothetical protein
MKSHYLQNRIVVYVIFMACIFYSFQARAISITISSISYDAGYPIQASGGMSASLSIAFSKAGGFASGNVFTAQLSNATGSFASATNIGTLAGTSAGVINATIPANTAAGSGYRIRIVASNPSIISADNGIDLIITYPYTFGGNGRGDIAKTCSDISITSQPNSADQITVINSSTQSLNVAATSSGSITYQWYRNTTASNTGGTSVGSASGGNTNTYTPSTNAVGTSYYYCMLSANGCTTVSNVSGAVVVNCATFTSQPNDTDRYVGLNVSNSSLSVVVSASGSITYQWYRNVIPQNTGGTSISGANTNSYIPLSNAVSRYYYYCTVSVAGCSPGITSNVSGAINVQYLPAFFGGNGRGDVSRTCTDINITAQPSTTDQQVAVNGTPQNISITATSSNAITYQWYSNTTASNVGGTSVGTASGGTTNTFTPPTNATSIKYYYCMLSANGCATVSSVSGAVNVSCANFTSQPITTDQNIGLGDTATLLSVSASSSVSLTYQWYKNTLPQNTGGTLISSNGTSNSYRPLSNSIGRSYYYCVATANGCSPSLSSNVSGAVNVSYLPAFYGGIGKGDASVKVKNTYLSGTILSNVSVALNAFLEGLYKTNSMQKMIASPYSADGITPQNIADTITVELRSDASPYSKIYSFKTTLDTAGLAHIILPTTAIDSSYFIIIKHRNSIETWSANSQRIIPIGSNYNFTTSANKAYGNNMRNMGSGVYAIYTGDITQDGSIDFNDYPDLDIGSNNGDLGYFTTDLNGDASVDFNDYPTLDINSNDGIIAIVP